MIYRNHGIFPDLFVCLEEGGQWTMDMIGDFWATNNGDITGILQAPLDNFGD